MCRAADEPMVGFNAWTAARQMGIGVNIGNTLENTTRWETGWGNPRITQGYVESLARLGFKTVRVPVAWDTYARDGRIAEARLARVAEVVDWILGAGLYCVVNIHWDGGWIDSSNKEKFRKTFATFSADAQKKFPGYWTQIANYFADRNERLVFEALNEETNFEREGSTQRAFATLTRVNQLFIDTVRKTGGNNAKRLLVVTGANRSSSMNAVFMVASSRLEFSRVSASVSGEMSLAVTLQVGRVRAKAIVMQPESVQRSSVRP